MLKKDEETEAKQVNWDDQQKINEFGRLNFRFHELKAEMKAKTDLIQTFEDASLELELLDDDERAKYYIGESFIEMSGPDAVTRLEERVSIIRTEVEKMDEEASKSKTRMAELRVALYDKFGNAINLEDQETI